MKFTSIMAALWITVLWLLVFANVVSAQRVSVRDF